MAKRNLVLLVARADSADRDVVAMTLGWMCAAAGWSFDAYYAADHGDGGLFARQGSTVVGGHHAGRVARALAQFDAVVVRLDGVSLFDPFIRRAARRLIDAPADPFALHAEVAALLGIDAPTRALLFDPACGVPLPTFYPECAARGAIAALAGTGVGGELFDASGDDPALACVERHLNASAGIDLYEPAVASAMLAFNQRSRRLILPYATREQAVQRRDQMLALTRGRPQAVAYGRWFGDPQLQPLAAGPTAFQVVEPNRHVLSVFADDPTPLPQPARSWADLEPDDAQLHAWSAGRKVLAGWVLHSGELSHDDSVMAFIDWSSMTKVRIGAGVHWQRYHLDPDAVEPMHVPQDEGGVLGLVEPVLHSAGGGIMWETAGDPARVAAMMRDAVARIAEVAGERFVPRGVYCFGDHFGQDDSGEPSAPQRALWEAIRLAGFEYVVTSALHGPSRVLYANGGFVVLNQCGRFHTSSPFVRGTPTDFADHERQLAAADRPGWMIGAIDTPIHGCPVYVGRPYVCDGSSIRINEFYDYVQNGGATGRIVSATPRTVARYAHICSKGAH